MILWCKQMIKWCGKTDRERERVRWMELFTRVHQEQTSVDKYWWGMPELCDIVVFTLSLQTGREIHVSFTYCLPCVCVCVCVCMFMYVSVCEIESKRESWKVVSRSNDKAWKWNRVESGRKINSIIKCGIKIKTIMM